MRNKILGVLLLLSAIVGQAQVSNEGKPKSWRLSNVQNLEPLIMPTFNLDSLQKEDVVNDAKMDKPWRFGHEFFVDNNLANSGEWSTLPDGSRIWRIRYKSEGAKTMNFLFSDFYMPEGATLYLYNDSKTDVLGAYTSSQNNEERVLGSWLVKGDDIWLEYHEPKDVAGEGKLEVFKVVHGYRTIAFQDDINNSDYCMYDAECYMEGINNLKDISKKSIALLIVNSSGFCTGALINNTSNDGTPYLLTANHCYSNPSLWAFNFNWKSDNPVCGAMLDSEIPTNFHYTTSGAALRARDGLSDFALVELNSDIPQNWGLVWSGWDRSQTTPPYVYGLHHPRGSVMKVSVDYDAPAMTPGGLDDGLVWTIFGWEVGGLQPGSSGSPLLDNNGRIRGQAWYIDNGPICQGINTGWQSSGYGRLNVAWDARPTPQRRLKEWLDPGNTGAMTTDFYPLQSTPASGASIQFYKFDNFDCGNDITPAIRLINNGIQAITSAQISYSYNNGSVVPLNWTGNLDENQSTIIDLPVLISGEIENNVNVNLISINGSLGGLSGSANISTLYHKMPAYNADLIDFQIRTDMMGRETSWELINEDGITIDSRPTLFYENGQTYNHSIAVEPGCYTLAIKDSYGDGICCFEGIGEYTLSTSNGNIIKQGGNFNSREYIRFKILGILGTEQNSMEEAAIYPNPSSGIFTITVPYEAINSQYEIYTITGQKIAGGTLKDAENTVNISGVSNGIYIVKMKDNSQMMKTFKIVVGY